MNHAKSPLAAHVRLAPGQCLPLATYAAFIGDPAMVSVPLADPGVSSSTGSPSPVLDGLAPIEASLGVAPSAATAVGTATPIQRA